MTVNFKDLYRLLSVATTLLGYMTVGAQQITIGSDEYDALKASGDLFEDGLILVNPPEISTAIHTEIYSAGHGVNNRNVDCGCWVEPDASYTQAGFPSNPNVDDGSSNQIPIPFSFCLYGDNYSSFYINTNGNISFGDGFGTFTPQGFPMGTAMIAPFWADVDLSCNNCGDVFYKVTQDAVYINWIDVGYFPDATDKVNNFQIIITNGSNEFVGVGRNVAFCYRDMQWTTGSASGGVGGFGGTAATAGANRGNNSNFVQFGRFNQNNDNYDGPFGADDGINWLDLKSFVFDVCAEDNNNNIPPIVTGATICDTLKLCQNASLDFEVQFLSPENGQITNIVFDNGGMSGISDVSITNGNTATFSCTFTGNANNTGINELTLTGTDNGNPNATTTFVFYVEVLEEEVPEITISGTLDFCGGGSTLLTASTGFDEYVWNTGCSEQSCEVSSDGLITVTGFYQGCSSSASVETVETDYFIPPITIAEQPICSNDSTLVTSNNVYNTYSWANYLDYPGTIYSDNTSQQSAYLSAGTFVLQVTTDGGCIGQRIFNIDATDATIPEDTWSGAYCEGLQDLEFCCGYASADAGNFTLYMFNTQGNWTLASLDIYVNGELILENVQAPTPNTPLWTPGFTIYYGDFIEIFYDPGNSTGTHSLKALNCTNSPLQLFTIPLTGEGLIWSGFAACPSSPPVGYWEVIDGPEGSSFSDETQWNSTFSPGDYGTYNLHFFSATCGIDYFYEVTYSATPGVTIDPSLSDCGAGQAELVPEINNPLGDASISWDNGQTEPSIIVSESGTYCVTVSNACGSPQACIDVLIDPIPQLELETEYLLCDQSSITLDPIAIDHESIVYSWSGPGLNSSESSVTITQTGNYSVSVENDCGTDSQNFFVLLDPTPLESPLLTNYLLCDQASLTIDPVTNDDDSYTYSWQGPNGFSSSNSQETLTQSGDYSVSVQNQCGNVNANFSVVLEPTPVANPLEASYLLCGDPSIVIDPVANDDDSYIYSWEGPNGFSSSNSQETLTQNGLYSISAVNDCGIVEAEFTLTIVEDLSLSVNNLNLCDQSQGTLVASVNQDGVAFEWSGGQSSSSIAVSQNGQYCVTATNACESISDCGNVNFEFSPELSVNPSSIQNLCPGINVTLNANAGNAGNLNWEWVIDCGETDNVIDNSSTSQVISGDLATEFCPEGFTVMISASNVCGSTAVSVPVDLDACLITLPNVFSPNNDDVNDIFIIDGLENYIAFGGVTLKVFNRWGNLVFESDNYKNNWDAEGLEAGTYYYVLILPNKNEAKGAVTLVK
jgi:gliding motility-associated-like protein